MITDAYFDSFSTKKYRAKNPLKRMFIRRFVGRIEQLIAAAGPCQSVLEIGCGEGFLLGHLSRTFPDKSFSGVDLNEHDLELLREHFGDLDVRAANVYDLSGLPGGYDLVICAEVLEHLDQPVRGLEQIASLGAKRVILTVPHEPWFMLSNLLVGKNVARFGDDIEHVNHFRPRSFRRLIESHFEVLDLTTSYPWILTLNGPRQ